MTILISLLLLLNNPLELLYPISSNGIAPLANSLDLILRQGVAWFWVAFFFFFFLVVIFSIVTVVSWPGYIHEI